MKRALWPAGGFAAALGLAGCMTQSIPPTNYYVLEYYPQLEAADLVRPQPFPFVVQVLDARIPRAYDRKQIVVRDVGPRFSYATGDLWGSNLAESIPNLLAARLERYRVFRAVRREYAAEPSDYEISTQLDAIELVRAGAQGEARVGLEFALNPRGSAVSVVRHRAARQQRLADTSVETFVIAANDMILEEIDRFVDKVERYLETGETSEPAPEAAEGALEPAPDQGEGFGVLLLPALTGGDQEPFYHVFSSTGAEVVSAKMGEPVVLPEGRYRILYGSGREDQLMELRGVLVVPRYKRIVEPQWGALVVSVITEDRESVRVPYEVFDGSTGDSYGADISADETLGEQPKAWVLRPGLYKITIRGEPFSTYKNFTTIDLAAGDAKRLTIVVGVDEAGAPADLVGAGVLEAEPSGAGGGPLRVTSTIGATVDLASNNEVDPTRFETQTTLAGESDTRLVLDWPPLLYSLRAVVEAGVTKSPDTDFRVSSDDLRLKNTLIYFFFADVGFYGRFDLDTHLFPENIYFDSPTDIRMKDTEGRVVEEQSGVSQVQVKPMFFPLVLREGVGLNYRVINEPRAELSVRAGFGLRQGLNPEVYSYEGDEGGFRVYRELASEYQTGIEVSALGAFVLPFGLTYTLSVETLFPFESGSDISFDWENILSLRLLRYLSLEYRLDLSNRVPADPEHYFMIDHRFLLRVIYVIR